MSDSSSFRLYLGFTQSEEINYLIGLKSDSDSPFGFGAVAWGRGNCLLLLSRIGVSGLGGLLRKKRAYVFYPFRLAHQRGVAQTVLV